MPLPHVGLAGVDPYRVVHDAVEDGVGNGVAAETTVPFLSRQLGCERGAGVVVEQFYRPRALYLSLAAHSSHYKRYLMKKRSRYAITLVVKYTSIRLSKELDCILMMPKSGHFSDVVLIQSQRAWGCLCLRLLHRLPFCLQKVCHRPIAAESSVFSVRFC